MDIIPELGRNHSIELSKEYKVNLLCDVNPITIAHMHECSKYPVRKGLVCDSREWLLFGWRLLRINVSREHSMSYEVLRTWSYVRKDW